MKGLSILIMLFLSSLAFANEVGYEVEIIIFEDTTEFYKNSEKWQEKMDNAIEAPIDTELSNEQQNREKYLFENMKLSESRLAEYARKLNEHPDYNVLVHKKWKQTGLDNNNAFPVSIDSRVIDEAIKDASETAVNSTQQAAIEEDKQQLDSSVSVSSYIVGEITLIMSRYLHLRTDLILHKPISNQMVLTYTNLSTDEINKFSDYKLNFERRMRSREVHYIDHPLGGIIVLAMPFKIKTDSDIDSSEKTYKTL
ncbi:MAG: peptidoglycan binding protein CsiV [Gammaproteobacteria bacterium]|nr:peptidoglycan binding protein CsiV [Gammaproteobacteria bacterium]